MTKNETCVQTWIRKLENEDNPKPHDQIVAIAFSKCRKGESKEHFGNKVVAYELFQGDLTILDLPNRTDEDGTVMTGLLAYPGISKNGKFYPPEELAKGDGKRLPVILNHGDAIGTEDVGDDLLPPIYRARLEAEEEIILGFVDLFWSWESLQLTYRAVIVDPFYKQKEILQRLAVSQGILHFPFDQLEKVCSQSMCFPVIDGTEYSEISIVFHPGFSIATVSVEKQLSSKNRQTYKQLNPSKGKMSKKTKSDENCNDCSDEQEGQTDIRADAPVKEIGECGEGMMIDPLTGECVKIPSTTPAGPAGVQTAQTTENVDDDDDDDDKKKKKSEEQDDDDDDDDDDDKKKKSEEQDDDDDDDKDKKKKPDSTEKVLKELDKNLGNVKKSVEKSKELEKIATQEAKEYRAKIDKQYPTTKKPSNEGIPNFDTKSHQVAQESYNKTLATSLKSQESMQKVLHNILLKSAENAKQRAVNPSKEQNKLTVSIERAESSMKSWIDSIIKSPSNEKIPWHKSYLLSNEYLAHAGLLQRFKNRIKDDRLGSHEFVGYWEQMKKLGHSKEAVNVVMAGGADPNNFQRTMSEMVLVDPEGRIVTPIEQFCETKLLNPGQKEAFFYDINTPRFKATDEANLDADGGGFALAPSTVTINASGGKTNAEGALARIGFTDLEEIPIDIIQKYNVGLAMEAAERRNFEVLTSAYNVDTVYDPLVDDVKPKGGGTKDGRWIRDDNTNATTAGPDTDASTNGPMVFVNLLKAKSIIGVRGVSVENLKAYVPFPAIQQLVNDANISTYTQRSKPEIITQGVVERLSGIDLIPTSSLALGINGGATEVRRSVVFIPQAWAAFVVGRELQIDAERVARDQSIYLTASQKLAAFIKKVELTARISTQSASFD